MRLGDGGQWLPAGPRGVTIRGADRPLRIPAIRRNKIVYDPHRSAEEFHAQLPAQVRWKADNYNNLMEQPTLLQGNLPKADAPIFQHLLADL
jgi:hypothetical protein